MCGGEGSRLETETEKPLFEIDGVPMVDRVTGELSESRAGGVYAAVSPKAPRTARRIRSGGAATAIETPGDGYVEDLGAVLETVEPPVLTIACDIPLLDARSIDRILERAEDRSLTVAVPAELKRLLGVSVDTTIERGELAPSGVNIVGDDPGLIHTTTDVRFAVNVNRARDAEVAEVLAGW